MFWYVDVRFFDWLIDRLTYLTKHFQMYLSGHWLIDRFVDWLIVGFIGWLIDWLIDRSFFSEITLVFRTDCDAEFPVGHSATRPEILSRFIYRGECAGWARGEKAASRRRTAQCRCGYECFRSSGTSRRTVIGLADKLDGSDAVVERKRLWGDSCEGKGEWVQVGSGAVTHWHRPTPRTVLSRCAQGRGLFHGLSQALLPCNANIATVSALKQPSQSFHLLGLHEVVHEVLLFRKFYWGNVQRVESERFSDIIPLKRNSSSYFGVESKLLQFLPVSVEGEKMF